MEIIRRLIAWILILCFTLQNPVYILAENPGGSHGSNELWRPSTGGSNYVASAATFKTYGYKATITQPGDNFSAITTLGDTYTMDDLAQQFASMEETLKSTYYEPGNWGINLWAVDPKTGSGIKFSADTTNGLATSGQAVNYSFKEAESHKYFGKGNPLAWAIWQSEDPDNTPYVYNEEIAYLFTAEGAAACGDADSWIKEVNRLYDTIQVTSTYISDVKSELPVSKQTPENVFLSLFTDGEKIAAKFREITWVTNLDELYHADQDQYIKALCSRIGLVTLDAVMCLVAYREYASGRGVLDWTYLEMAEKTYAWITSDYAIDNMAMIMVESTSGINTQGNTSGSVDFVTLINHMAMSYGTQEILMGNWPEDCYNSNKKAMVWSTNGAAVSDGWTGPFNQGTAGYPHLGAWKEYNDTCYAGRAYLKTLLPRDTEQLFGYFINWTYDAVCGPSSSGSKNTMGSFTWKLNPDGVNDKTPAEEINASSTIYDLNIAQDGYNANNYMSDWVPTVRQDNATCNKLRIRIYHVSENLTEDQQATEYARDAVKKQGKPVTEAITKVTPGDGVISG